MTAVEVTSADRALTWLTAVARHRRAVGSGGMLAAVALADAMNAAGEVRASPRSIGERVGLGEPKAREALGALIAAEFVDQIGGLAYRLTIPAARQLRA